ncbi:MAG TPA: NAD(P)-dependent oxidoreductase [Lentimicrobium sp.]|nr:NAD(P)-dependent oxidoreductase [Lentimicrobium sp.]
MDAAKNILITGASGFIGNFLTDEALSRGYNVFAAVRKTTDTSILREKKVNLVQIDFYDCTDIFDKISSLPPLKYIIHNAGIIRAVKKEDFHEVNFGNTKRLINVLMRTSKVPDKFLYISSLASLGPCNGQFRSPIGLLTEPAPVTEYGKSKLETERLIESNDWLPYIILRPTAVYGPGDKDMYRLIRFINMGIDLQLGTGSQRLTFIYIKDLVSLAFIALESEVTNKSYCVSDGNPYSEYDFGKAVAGCLHRKVMHVAVPVRVARAIAAVNEYWSTLSGKAPVLNVDKINELSAKSWCCDTRPLMEDFFFRAGYDLQRGMAETIEWYRKMKWI